jgi:dolichyl-phosphate-mannose-protein mannosyltransferase
MSSGMVRTSARGSAPAARTAESAGRRSPRRALWLSLLVAATAVGVQWVIMTPPLYYDPYYVWEAARSWPDIPLDQWPFSTVPHQVTRLGLVLPAMVVQHVLGPGQAAYFTIAAIGGVLFFVGCYLAIRSLFGDLIGAGATLLLIVHPFFTLTNPFTREVTWSAGVMLPDMPGAGLFAFGVAALVTASRREGRAQTRLLLAAGCCFGSAFLIREFLAFLYLAIPVFFLLLRVPWRRMFVLAAPMVAILAANLIHNAIVWGTPLAGLRSAAEHAGTPAEPISRVDAAGSVVRAMVDWQPLGVLFLGLLALNVAGLAITRDRRLALTLAWFLALWAPLTVLSGVLNPHEITLRGWLVRYWFAVFPALLAGGLGAVALLAGRLPRAALRPAGRRIAGGLIAALAAVYLVVAVRTVPGLPRDTAWSELRGWLKGRGDIPVIWSDHRLAQTLTFYTRSVWGDPLWRGQIRSFPHETRELPAEAAQGPFLYTRWRGQEPAMVGGWRPSEAAGWRLLWRSDDGVLELWRR